MNQSRRAALYASLAVISTAAWAATSIGVAFSRGSLQVDSASVRGTANVSDGSSVQTQESAGQIQLNSGVQLVLGTNSAAEVFGDRVELPRASVRFRQSEPTPLTRSAFTSRRQRKRRLRASRMTVNASSSSLTIPG